jgi:hypothetical protein
MGSDKWGLTPFIHKPVERIRIERYEILAGVQHSGYGNQQVSLERINSPERGIGRTTVGDRGILHIVVGQID